MMRLRELRVDEWELIDRRRHPETRHVGGEQLLVKGVGGYLRLEVVVHLPSRRHIAYSSD